MGDFDSKLQANKLLDEYRQHYGHMLDAYSYAVKQRYVSPWQRVDEELQRAVHRAGATLRTWRDEMNRKITIILELNGDCRTKEYSESDLYDESPDEVLADLLGTLLELQGK